MHLIEDHPVFPLISSQQQIDELAQELADDYAEYFSVDLSREQDKYQDAIEECLAHLEENIAALEELKQNGSTVDRFMEIVNSKSVALSKLYAQVDAMEQYLFETSRLFDQLDVHICELERHHKSKTGKIKQIINKIPGIASMPRVGLFSGISSLIYDNPASFSQADECPQLEPIPVLIERVQQVESLLSGLGINLNKRLHGDVDLSETRRNVNESMAALSLSSTENVDGSWQELL